MMPAANARHAMAERRIETHAGALQVCVTGHGRTPLVLWHALFADPSMFEPLVERLAPNYRLLLVAAPGHGASGLPADRLTSAASGAAVLAILDAYEIPRAGVVGCSWGGIAGIQAALQAPHRIVAVAAFNTPLGPGTRDLGSRAIVTMAGWIGGTTFFGRRVAAEFFGRMTHARYPERVARFVEGFRGRDPSALRRAARAVLMERESLLPALPAIQVPLLIVSGAEDRRYPSAEAAQIAGGVPRARFVEAPGSAHLTPLENPMLAERLVRDLLIDAEFPIVRHAGR